MRKTFGMARALFAAALAMMFAGAAAPSAPTTAPSTQPAKELTLDLGDKVSLKLALIPAGKFLMGSPETGPGHFADEVQHEVTISKPFYMGMTHVTVDQFAVFAKDSEYKTDAEKDGRAVAVEIAFGKFNTGIVASCSWRNPGFDQKGDHPVVEVSWNDATAFCEWLTKKCSKTVTLPTEAQWEYACRAGTKTAYPWGDNPNDGKGWANCADESLKQKLPNQRQNPPDMPITYFSWDDGFVFTSPVGRFKPNAFGIYDMIGNTWQWCQDRYGDYDMGPVTDPEGAATGELRVLRGGSWSDLPVRCRAACRSFGYPVNGVYNIGFRVAVAAGGD